jgi:hypothetical protein
VLLAMTTAQAGGPPWSDPPTPWLHSTAKRKLYDDIVSGRVGFNDKPRVVFSMHDGFYKRYEYCNFRSNLLALKKDVQENLARAEFDSKALENDRKKHPPPSMDPRGYPVWNGSDAERMLKEDVLAGKHKATDPLTGKTITPNFLQQTRPAYKAFPLEVFRDHVNQVTRDGLERSYWMAKKASKKEQTKQKAIARARRKKK